MRTRRRYIPYAIRKEMREKPCACCGETGDIHLDHVKPLALGGPDEISNLQPLCQRCNARKNKRDLTLEQLRLLRGVTYSVHRVEWGAWSPR